MTSFDDLELERVIGRGSTGTVWRARWHGPVTRTVAVKRTRVGAGPDAARRLRAEATLLASCDHPHVLRLLDVVAAGDDVALVLPYAEGGSLADRLADAATTPIDAALALVIPVADALGSLHVRGIVHRDVAPGNLLLTADGAPLLADLGSATTDAAAPTTPTGTAGYVDPHVLTGGTASPASDVHALAVVLHRLLAGRLPYPGEDDAELVAAARAGRRVPTAVAAPHAPAALATLVDAALDPDPRRRPADGRELASALRAVGADARDPTPVPHDPAPVGRVHVAVTRDFAPSGQATAAGRDRSPRRSSSSKGFGSHSTA